MAIKAYVTKDRELAKAADMAGEELAKHRWHWTLDESNPGRVSISQYAREVGVTHAAVSTMVNGYVAWAVSSSSQPKPGTPTTLHEHVRAAHMSEERQQAAGAIAKATGRSFGEAAQPRNREEVTAVIAQAQD